MTRPELLRLYQVLCGVSRVRIQGKIEDYATGDDPLRNFRLAEAAGLATAEQGLLVRVCDKVARLIRFSQAGKLSVVDESVEDTAKDLINYCVLLIALVRDGE